MPPDITSIDSDINKIGALTPSPFLGDMFEPPYNMTNPAARQQRRNMNLPNQSAYPNDMGYEQPEGAFGFN